ncbi:MAG: hypothetical protein AAF127_08940 [Pseudomonadota bacterium]
MDSFLFCLILTTAIAMGGRDQLMVAQFSDALATRGGGEVRRPVPLLMLGVVSAFVTAAAMSFGALTIAAMLPPRAAHMLIAFALAIAAFECAWPVRIKPVREPTRSLGAIALVLGWRQIGDAARFVIFALAAEATFAGTAFLGGALGGAAATTLGWTLGKQELARWPLIWWRRALALALICAALVIGLNARYQFR